jgi:integrase
VDNQRHYIYAPTKVAAQEKLKAAIAAFNEPAVPQPVVPLTFTVAYTRFLAEQSSLKPRTIEGYRGIYQLAAKQFGEHRLVAEIRATDLTAYAVVLGQRVGAKTIRNALIAIMACLHWCGSTITVPLPSAKGTPARVLTAEQGQKLLQQVQGHRLEGPILIALTTGMRAGEILALTWQSFDAERGTLTVREAYSVGYERRFGRGRPKTTAGLRTIPLLPRARAYLASLPQGQPDALIFAAKDGGPLHGKDFSRSVRLICVKNDLPEVKFHGLRHTTATLLLERGVNPLQVSALLGHTSVHVTLGVYAHLTRRMEAEAMAKLGDAFGLPLGLPLDTENAVQGR